MWQLGTSIFVLLVSSSLICSDALALYNLKYVPSDLTRSIGCIFSDNFLLINENLFIYVRFSRKSPKSNHFLRELAEEVMHAIDNITFTVNFDRPVHYRSYLHYQLVLVDDAEALMFLYEDLRQHGTANLSYTIIYISNISNSEHEDVKRSFEVFWQLSILNVGIILRLVSRDLVMLSYFPYRPQRCRIVEPVVVNRFDAKRMQWLSPIYFPEKLRNFYGCQLVCATWEDMPYMQAEYSANGEIAGFKGIEGNLLAFISSNLNFSVGVHFMSDSQIMESFNETGLIFNEIFDQYADYALGAFHYKPDMPGTAPFSQTNYYYLSHIYLVTNVFDIYSTYEKLAFPFRSLLWLSIGIVFLLGYSVICVSRFCGYGLLAFISGHRITAPYYNMFVIAVGAPSATIVPRRNFARFLLAVWLLATLVLRSAYQSGMYQLLRDDSRRDPPQTIAMVADQLYTFAMTPENVRFMRSLPEVKEVRFLNTTELQAFPALAVSKERMAIITPYEYFGYFRKINSLSRRLHLVRERVFTQQLSFYVRRNSYLVDVLNGQIAKAQALGYSSQWKREFIYGVQEYRDAAASDFGSRAIVGRDSKPTQSNVLSIKELEAIFMILVWMYLCCIMVLVVEVLCAIYKALMRPS